VNDELRADLQLAVDPDSAWHFLQVLFGDLADNEHELPFDVCLVNMNTKFTYWTKSLLRALALAIAVAGSGADAYVHVAGHDFECSRAATIRHCEEKGWQYSGYAVNSDGDRRSKFRGKIQSARALPGIWIDLDYGHTGHQKKNLPPDKESAELIVAAVADLGFPPSLVVHTGGGLHVYWLFREAWLLELDAERERASALVRAIEREVGRIAAAIGLEREGVAWEIDATHDLARVLRVPGTVNMKTGVPRPVRIIREGEVRYNPSDLEEHPAVAAALCEVAAASGTSSSSSRSPRFFPGGSPSTGVLERVGKWLKTQMSIDSALRCGFLHEHNGKARASPRPTGGALDESLSGRDFRIARMAARWRLSSEEIHALLFIHARHHRRVPEEKPPSYYARTIAKAEDAARAQRVSRPWLVQAREEAEKSTALAPEGPAPTRPPVTTDLEAGKVMEDIAESYLPGDRSLAVAAGPGTWKTSTLMRRFSRGLAERKPGFEKGVAVIAFLTRALVDEKCTRAEQIAQEDGLSVRALLLCGRSEDPRSGWFCPSMEAQSAQAELHRWGCGRCSRWEECACTSGHYQYERGRVLEHVRAASRGEEAPVLLVVTLDALHWLWRDLPRRIPIVLDDAGPTFGLLREVMFRHANLQKAAEDAREWIDRKGENIERMEAERDRSNCGADDRDQAWNEVVEAVRQSRSPEEAQSAVEGWLALADRSDLAAKARIKSRELWNPNDQGSFLRSLASVHAHVEELPHSLVAHLVATVLEAIPKTPWKKRESGSSGAKKGKRKGIEPTEPIRDALARLPDLYRRALERGEVRPQLGPDLRPEWPWEIPTTDDGPDSRPAFTDVALEIARETLQGFPPVKFRAPQSQRASGGPEHGVQLPDRELVSRAQAGWVVWLGVGVMPSFIAEAMNIHREIVDSRPRGLDVVAVQVVRDYSKRGDELYMSFGPGDRRPGEPSKYDEIVRAFCTRLMESAAAGPLSLWGHEIKNVGGVLHKVDWEALGKPEGIAYYGAGHMGTDALKDVDTLIVRRHLPPFSAISRTATALRRALRMPDAEKSGAIGYELRCWADPAQWHQDEEPLRHVRGATEVWTSAFLDPLEREMQRFYECHHMLNAVGRCRPLSNSEEGRLVILLVGIPFDGVEPERRYLKVLLEDLEIPLAEVFEVDPNLAQAARERAQETVAIRIVDRQVRLLQILIEGEPGLSTLSLARTLKVNERTIRRDLKELGEAYPDQFGRGCGDATLRTSGDLYILIPRMSEMSRAGELPSAAGVHRFLEATEESVPGLRAVQHAVRRVREAANEGAPGVLPTRSDARRVVESVLSVLELEVAWREIGDMPPADDSSAVGDGNPRATATEAATDPDDKEARG